MYLHIRTYQKQQICAHESGHSLKREKGNNHMIHIDLFCRGILYFRGLSAAMLTSIRKINMQALFLCYALKLYRGTISRCIWHFQDLPCLASGFTLFPLCEYRLTYMSLYVNIYFEDLSGLYDCTIHRICFSALSQ